MADLELMDPVQVDADLRNRDLRIEALEADLSQAIVSRDGFAEARLKVEAENARIKTKLGGVRCACQFDPDDAEKIIQWCAFHSDLRADNARLRETMEDIARAALKAPTDE